MKFSRANRAGDPKGDSTCLFPAEKVKLPRSFPLVEITDRNLLLHARWYLPFVGMLHPHIYDRVFRKNNTMA